MRLIEAIKIQSGCRDTDDLKNFSSSKKKRIADLIEERIPAKMPSIDEWNEVIGCFCEQVDCVETDNNKAKETLLALLRK